MSIRNMGIYLFSAILLIAGCASTGDDKESTIPPSSLGIEKESTTNEKTTSSVETSSEERVLDTESEEKVVDTSSDDESYEIIETELQTENETYSWDKKSFTEEVSYEMLSRYPDECEEKLFKISGIIGQIVAENFEMEGYTCSQYRLYVEGDENQVLFVTLVKNENMKERIMEGDKVTFYGSGGGMVTGKGLLGNTIILPSILAVLYDILDDNNISTKSNENDVSSAEPNIKELLIYDNNGVKVTAKKIEYDDRMGPELRLLVENNTGKNIGVQAKNTSINGFMVHPTMSIEVVNGKKASGTMSFHNFELEEYGIDTIEDIEFSLYVFERSTLEILFETPLIDIKTEK